MHKPKILFLDEPTAGLDTKSRHMLWDLIRQLNNAGTTIFLTTHYIEEAEDLCDRVAILNLGSVVALGSPKELCDSIGRITVEYYENNKKIMLQFPDRQAGKDFMATLKGDTTMSLRRTTLEDVFLIMTGEEYSNGGA
jgi:ABC-2 type transport system ATP-binding protein